MLKVISGKTGVDQSGLDTALNADIQLEDNVLKVEVLKTLLEMESSESVILPD